MPPPERQSPLPRPRTERFLGWTDRELLVRGVELGETAHERIGVLAEAYEQIEHRQEVVEHAHDALEIHVEALDQRVSSLEQQTPYREHTRVPDASWHEYDEAAEQVRLFARAQVKDSRHPKLTRNRVKGIFNKAMQELREEAELDTWRRIKKLTGKVAWEVTKLAIPSGLGALAYHLWRVLRS